MSRNIFKREKYSIMISIKEVKCPICNNEMFSKGPRGGLSQNIKCNKCKSVLNITPFGIDIIENATN